MGSFIFILALLNLFVIRMAIVNDPEYLWMLMATFPVMLLMIHLKKTKPFVNPEYRENRSARQRAEQTGTIYTSQSLRPRIKEREMAMLR